jgi:oligopeptide/dipeptide ABC transporter ATP-binding protein
MRELMDKVSTSILLVTHDLAVASQVADRVVVMYASEIAEDSNVYDLFSDPLHPYTRGLLSCIPSGNKKDSSLVAIPGSLPDLSYPPEGCRFAPRCRHVMNICYNTKPRLLNSKENHKVSCFLYGE